MEGLNRGRELLFAREAAQDLLVDQKAYGAVCCWLLGLLNLRYMAYPGTWVVPSPGGGRKSVPQPPNHQSLLPRQDKAALSYIAGQAMSCLMIRMIPTGFIKPPR